MLPVLLMKDVEHRFAPEKRLDDGRVQRVELRVLDLLKVHGEDFLSLGCSPEPVLDHEGEAVSYHVVSASAVALTHEATDPFFGNGAEKTLGEMKFIPGDGEISVVDLSDGKDDFGRDCVFFGDEVDENVREIRVMTFVNLGQTERGCGIGVMFFSKIC